MEYRSVPKTEIQNSSCDSLAGFISNVLHIITVLNTDKVQNKIRLTAKWN